jgi:hypothetical protein
MGASVISLWAWGGASGGFRLYDDQGVGFGYDRRAYTWTPVSYSERRDRWTLAVGRANGRFPGALRRRSWALRLVATGRPREVLIDGRRLRPRAWSYDAASRTLSVTIGALRTDRSVTISASQRRRQL